MPPKDLGWWNRNNPLVQQLLVVANEHAGVLGALRALAQDRHDLPRPPHRLPVIDA
jgi:hypothetical protein